MQQNHVKTSCLFPSFVSFETLPKTKY